MPRNLKRYYGANDLHFITCSCYQRRPLLASVGHRDLFLRVLEDMRQRYGFVVLGYVVMPEHFHLLISEPEQANPSTVMQAVKLGFVRRVIGQRPERQASLGDEQSPVHIWQRRFYDFNVWTEKKRVEKLRYMHWNPVKRGLVGEPEKWRWSSFRYYSYGEACPLRVNEWQVLKMKVRTV